MAQELQFRLQVLPLFTQAVEVAVVEPLEVEITQVEQAELVVEAQVQLEMQLQLLELPTLVEVEVVEVLPLMEPTEQVAQVEREL